MISNVGMKISVHAPVELTNLMRLEKSLRPIISRAATRQHVGVGRCPTRDNSGTSYEPHGCRGLHVQRGCSAFQQNLDQVQSDVGFGLAYCCVERALEVFISSRFFVRCSWFLPEKHDVFSFFRSLFAPANSRSPSSSNLFNTAISPRSVIRFTLAKSFLKLMASRAGRAQSRHLIGADWMSGIEVKERTKLDRLTISHFDPIATSAKH
jgi:hypothetical protein